MEPTREELAPSVLPSGPAPVVELAPLSAPITRSGLAGMSVAQRAEAVGALSRGYGNAAVTRVLARFEETPKEDAQGNFAADPNDGYLKPGVNWDTSAGSPGPAEAPDLKIRADAPGPVPIGFGRIISKGFFNTGNRLCANLGDLIAAYDSGAPAFRAAAHTLSDSYSASAPAIRQFHAAKAELDPGGALGPSPMGENWQAPSGGQKSLEELAEDQTLGGGKKLGSLFDGQSSVQGIDPATLGKGTKEQKEATSKLFEAARAKDLVVNDANRAYAKHLDETIPNALRDVSIAIKTKSVTSAEQERTAGDDAKARIELEKTQAVEGITAATSILRTAGAIATLPAGASAASDLIGTIGVTASAIVAGNYNGKIEEAHERVIGVRRRIDAIRADIAADQFDKAMAAYDGSKKDVETKVNGIRLALNDRKNAYAAAAKSAGEQAGGGEQGARVQSAINAIPRVQTVVARIGMVTERLQLPAYSEAAGKGLAAALANGDPRCDGAAFVKVASLAKGYHAEFDGLQKTWQGRLTSLQSMTGQLNVPGT